MTLQATADPTPVPIKTYVATGIEETLNSHVFRMSSLSHQVSNLSKFMMLAAAFAALFLADAAGNQDHRFRLVVRDQVIDDRLGLVRRHGNHEQVDLFRNILNSSDAPNAIDGRRLRVYDTETFAVESVSEHVVQDDPAHVAALFRDTDHGRAAGF